MKHDKKEKVVVFIDCSPGNMQIKGIYDNLNRLINRYDRRMFIVPIPCIEYYFICAIQDSNVVVDSLGIKECVGKADYFNMSELLGQIVPSGKRCSTFEKFCKFTIAHAVMNCAKSTEKNDLAYGIYGRVDCNSECNAHKACCTDKTLEMKSQELLAQYPCVPGGINTVILKGIHIIKDLSDDELIELHNHQIDTFNEWCDRYTKADTTGKKYAHFDYRYKR